MRGWGARHCPKAKALKSSQCPSLSQVVQKTSTAARRRLPTYTRTLCVWLKDDNVDNEYRKFYVAWLEGLFLWSKHVLFHLDAQRFQQRSTLTWLTNF